MAGVNYWYAHNLLRHVQVEQDTTQLQGDMYQIPPAWRAMIQAKTMENGQKLDRALDTLRILQAHQCPVCEPGAAGGEEVPGS